MRSYPITLTGRIIGRGQAGRIFSEDMMFRDATGIIFLNYQQPFAIWNFIFAWFKLHKFQDQEVQVTGWYRRSPMPTVEVKSIRSRTDRSTAYTFHYKLKSWLALPIIAGIMHIYLRR